MSAGEINHLSTKPEDWNSEISDGIYVWSSNSTATKIGILRGIFEECNIQGSELSFEFRPEIDDEDE